MATLSSKLNYKGQNRILLMNHPGEFNGFLEELKLINVQIDYNPQAEYDFVLVFVKSKQEIFDSIKLIKGVVSEDVTLWVAYPKKSSKKYTSDISRENGWQPLGDIVFEGVRMEAIDNDWSALRFRNVLFINSLKRDKSRTISLVWKNRK